MSTSIRSTDPFEAFVTRDPTLRRSLARLRSWSNGPLGVLLTGEAGVGKSFVARMLHLAGAPSSSSFVIRSAAEPELPANMLATLDQGGATLVLDGLEHWSLASQVALVRVLAARDGAPVRVIGLSRLTVSRLQQEGRLHPALAQQWANRIIDIPPLRARPDDLVPLVEGMLRRARRDSITLDATTWRALAMHGWSDNVRELRRTIDAAVVQAKGEPLEPRHLVLDHLVPPSLEALAGLPFMAMRREVDAWYLRRLLHETSDNLSEASRRSGCSRKVLRERLRRHGLYRTGSTTTTATPAVAPSFAEEPRSRAFVALPSAPASEAEARACGVVAAEERRGPWLVVRRGRTVERPRAA